MGHEWALPSCRVKPGYDGWPFFDRPASANDRRTARCATIPSIPIASIGQHTDEPRWPKGDQPRWEWPKWRGAWVKMTVPRRWFPGAVETTTAR